MKKNISVKIMVMVLLLLCVSAITWAIQHRYFKVAPKPSVHKAVVKFADPVYDKALLGKFAQICRKYDTLKQNYTIKGNVSMVDKADSTTQVKNMSFVFCKKGNALYYQLGQTETINEDGLYLFIDHTARRILITRQKQVNYIGGAQNPAQMATTLKSEYYNLSGIESKGIQTISFINEHHITCKQYTVSFDTLNYEIKHVYTRLTNFHDPLNKNKDKITDMSISEWDSKALMSNYTLPGQVVKNEGKKWKTTRAYENYELISM